MALTEEQNKAGIAHIKSLLKYSSILKERYAKAHKVKDPMWESYLIDYRIAYGKYKGACELLHVIGNTDPPKAG